MRAPRVCQTVRQFERIRLDVVPPGIPLIAANPTVPDPVLAALVGAESMGVIAANLTARVAGSNPSVLTSSA